MAVVVPIEGSLVSDFTTYQDIRVALGVSTEEIEDAEIEIDTNRTVLAEAFDGLDAGMLAAVQDLPEDEENRTSLQLKFGRLARMFATYTVANQLLNSVEMFSFLKVADGRASAERAQEAFATLRTNIQAMLARVSAKLLEAYAALNPTAAVVTPEPLSFATAVGVAVDPVTNT